MEFLKEGKLVPKPDQPLSDTCRCLPFLMFVSPLTSSFLQKIPPKADPVDMEED